MPAGRKPTHSRAEYVATAIALADEQDLSSLTLRAIGNAMGVSTTAVYRYFPSKDQLVAAMRDALMAGVPEALEGLTTNDPTERLVAAALAFRSTVRRHPCLGQIVTMPATDGGAVAVVQAMLIGELEAMGLHGALLVRGYQQLESLVVGASAFDYADAPRHLSDRRTRFAGLDHPAFAGVRTHEQEVDANNEKAFEASVRAVLASLSAERDMATPTRDEPTTND